MAFIDTTQEPSYNPNMEDFESSSNNNRKLVLHFDIRNTVLVSDSVTNVSMEQALNSFLTGVVWGREHEKGQWVWDSQKPSLKSPTPDAMTYYKYLENLLVKTPSNRQLLRLATGNFTSENLGKQFYPCFESTLKNLHWEYDLEEDHAVMTMSGKDGKPYHYILRSVYKVIHDLYERRRDFSVVFRTYGLDAPNVIQSLEHGLKGNHPEFPRPLNLPLNPVVGRVNRSNCDKIIFTTNINGEQISYDNDRDIYNMLNSSTGVSGFMDDFIYWQSHDYNYDYAKPLYIDPHDPSVQHVFFDDNIRTMDDDSIVNIRMFDTKGCKTAKSLSKEEAAKFSDMCLVQADLLHAADNTDYFVDCVKECERNYSNFLQNYQMQMNAT